MDETDKNIEKLILTLSPSGLEKLRMELMKKMTGIKEKIEESKDEAVEIKYIREEAKIMGYVVDNFKSEAAVRQLITQLNATHSDALRAVLKEKITNDRINR